MAVSDLQVFSANMSRPDYLLKYVIKATESASTSTRQNTVTLKHQFVDTGWGTYNPPSGSEATYTFNGTLYTAKNGSWSGISSTKNTTTTFATTSHTLNYDNDGNASFSIGASQYKGRQTDYSSWSTSYVTPSGATGSQNVALTNIGVGSWTVSYNANGRGSAPASQTKKYGTTLTLQPFIATQGSATSKSTYTVTANANGGSLGSGAHGSATYRAEYETYSQTYWNTQSDGKGTNYASKGSYTANADVTLYAIWKTNSYAAASTYTLPTYKPTKGNTTASTITISFNTNGGGTAPASKSATKTTTYSFKGWFTAAKGGMERTTSSTITANETVYAQYNSSTSANYSDVTLPSATKSDSTSSCTVTFNGNNGTAAKSSVSSSRKTTYSLSGWYTATSGGSNRGSAGQSYTPSASETLYARWGSSTGNYDPVTLTSASRSSGTSCTVTFNGNGGTAAKSSLTSSGTTTYPFNGWYDSASGGNKIGNANASYTPTGNITLYARWGTASTSYSAITLPNATRSDDVSKYTVTFDGNGGTAAKSSLTSSKTTTYTMNGWGTTSTGGTNLGQAGASYTPTGNITAYALWTTNAGEQQAITLPDATRVGYTCLGWSTNPGVVAPKAVGSSYTPTGNVTFKAVWQAVPSTLNINSSQQYSVGQNYSFKVNESVSGFKYTLELYATDASSGARISQVVATKSTSVNYSATLKNEFSKAIAVGTTEGQINISLTTYNGDTLVGANLYQQKLLLSSFQSVLSVPAEVKFGQQFSMTVTSNDSRFYHMISYKLTGQASETNMFSSKIPVNASTLKAECNFTFPKTLQNLLLVGKNYVDGVITLYTYNGNTNALVGQSVLYYGKVVGVNDVLQQWPDSIVYGDNYNFIVNSSASNLSYKMIVTVGGNSYNLTVPNTGLNIAFNDSTFSGLSQKITNYSSGNQISFKLQTFNGTASLGEEQYNSIIKFDSYDFDNASIVLDSDSTNPLIQEWGIGLKGYSKLRLVVTLDSDDTYDSYVSSGSFDIYCDNIQVGSRVSFSGQQYIDTTPFQRTGEVQIKNITITDFRGKTETLSNNSNVYSINDYGFPSINVEDSYVNRTTTDGVVDQNYGKSLLIYSDGSFYSCDGKNSAKYYFKYAKHGESSYTQEQQITKQTEFLVEKVLATQSYDVVLIIEDALGSRGTYTITVPASDKQVGNIYLGGSTVEALVNDDSVAQIWLGNSMIYNKKWRAVS